MADITGTSLTTISATVQTLRRLSTNATTYTATSSNTAKLPSGLQSILATRRAVVSGDKVPAVLSASIYIGTTITNMLRSLANTVEVAATGLTKTYANTHVESGTRLSVVNISADLKRTLDHVNELVERVASGSANLLSSTSPTVTLKTGEFGGEINVAPQPLDTKGLNLDSLDLHSKNGIEEALGRLNYAITLAEQRVNGLKQLDIALNGTTSLNQALTNLGATGKSELRGVLVNLYA